MKKIWYGVKKWWSFLVDFVCNIMCVILGILYRVCKIIKFWGFNIICYCLFMFYVYKVDVYVEI